MMATENNMEKSNLEEKMFDLLQVEPGANNEPVYFIIDSNGDPVTYTGTVVYIQGTEDAWALSEETLKEMIRFFDIR